jgi:hypothetical protein
VDFYTAHEWLLLPDEQVLTHQDSRTRVVFTWRWQERMWQSVLGAFQGWMMIRWNIVTILLACDPRLSGSQALELAFLIAERMRLRTGFPPLKWVMDGVF